MAISDLADYLGDHESSHNEQFERRFGTGAEAFVKEKKEGFRDLLCGIAQEFLSERKCAEVTGTVTDAQSYVTTTTAHRESPRHGTSERNFAEVIGPATDAESYVTTATVQTAAEHRESSPHATIRSLSESSESEAYVVLNRIFAEPPVIESEQMLKTLLRIIAKHFLRPLGQGEFAEAKTEDKLKALIGGLTRDHFHPCEDIPKRVQSVLTSGDFAHALIETRKHMLSDLAHKIAKHPALDYLDSSAINILARTMEIIYPDCITPEDLHPNAIHPDEIDPEEEDEESPSNDRDVAKYFVRMEDVLQNLIHRFENDPHPFETDQELDELCSRVEGIRKGHCYRFSKKRLAKLFKKGLIMGPPLSLVGSSLMAEFGLQMP